MKKMIALLFLATMGLFAQPAPIVRADVVTPFRATNVATATTTISAQQLIGLLTGTPTGAATYTTDTAANICLLFPQYGRYWAWDYYVKNTSSGANTITFAAGTGVTLVGTGTIAQNFVRHFRLVYSTCTVGSEAVSLYSLETTAF